MDKSFGGVFTMGGRINGMDCAISSQDINGKVGSALMQKEERRIIQSFPANSGLIRCLGPHGRAHSCVHSF